MGASRLLGDLLHGYTHYYLYTHTYTNHMCTHNYTNRLLLGNYYMTTPLTTNRGSTRYVATLCLLLDYYGRARWRRRRSLTLTLTLTRARGVEQEAHRAALPGAHATEVPRRRRDARRTLVGARMQG